MITTFPPSASGIALMSTAPSAPSASSTLSALSAVSALPPPWTLSVVSVVSLLVGLGLLSWPGPGPTTRDGPRPGPPGALRPRVFRRGPFSARARRCLVWGCGATAATVLVGAGAIVVAGVAGLAVLIAAVVPGRPTRSTRLRARRDSAESWRTAALLDLLATALEAGLPMPRALEAVTEIEDSVAAAVLREVGRLLVLGASPADAWGVAGEDPALSPVAAAAVRSAVGGAKVAESAREAARVLRDRARAAGDRSAARAEVALTAPLALCFLPAFLCLGLAPVIIGLIGTLHLF